MKSSAPWSVKGIERDARETAKEAAKREGMTVGEWLNQMIYSAGEAEPSGGEVEGLKLRDIVTAIEHLHKRVAGGQTESAGAVVDMTRKIGDVVERVQRLERVKPAQGSNENVVARIERLEEGSGERERVNALKALEKAVAQVAVQFNAAQKTSMQRLDASERQLQELAARIDNIGDDGGDGASGVGFLKDAIDGLSARIARTERLASEAAKLTGPAGGSGDPDFIENTGNRLRVLGDEIKRGGDQIRTLEATIAKLSSQIDAAERRSAEGIQKVAETVGEMREQLSAAATGEASRADIDAAVAAASRKADDRIDQLQRTLNAMAVRPETNAAEAATETTVEPEEMTPDDDAGEDDIAAQAAALAEDIDALAADLDPDEDGAELAAGEPGASTAAAVAEDDAEDDDEDPFAFADEIDAALEATADESDDDDFSFELDDDGEAETAVEDKSEAEPESEAQRLLSEVKAVFGKSAAAGKAPEPGAGEDAGDTTGEDDLDAILADLDDLTGASEAPQAARKEQPGEEDGQDDEGADAETGAAPAAEDDASAKDSTDDKPDYLKAARRRAIEVSQRQAEDKRRLRRNLTPKQKAILAARARQKRLAAEAGATMTPDPQKISAARDALLDQSDETAGAGEKEKGRFAQMSAAAAAIGAKLPFVGKKPEAENAADAKRDQAPSRHGDRAAFETLKSTVSARPVSLALAVGIFLSIAALFYLVKDIVFPPPEPRANPRPQIAAQQPAAQTPEETAPAAAIPAAPAIDPRTLYIEAMAALNTANGDGDAAAAAIGTLEEAAALGHPPAQLQLGEFFKTGQGVDQDLGQARSWFRRSANGGNVLAMHRIGVMTARGDGGPADTAEAIGWFERAGNFGLVDSQYNLGAIYHPSSDGAASTVQDASQAYYWYSLAAKNGDEQASPLAAGVAALLTPEQKRGLDEAIADWEALPPDQAANELAPTG